MKGAALTMLVLLAVVQHMVKPGEAITCGLVDLSLAACFPYLAVGGSPVRACCDGLKNLKAITPTTLDRRVACNCVKAAADRYPVIKEDAASALPQRCGVLIDIPISRNVNCENIN